MNVKEERKTPMTGSGAPSQLAISNAATTTGATPNTTVSQNLIILTMFKFKIGIHKCNDEFHE